ncbi:MAG: hypothetical protein ACLQVJ_10485 [Syntrophobacteraceae bacterium]
MRTLSITLAIIAASVGLYAAFLWWKSSKVELVPLWEKFGRVEPGDTQASQAGWICGIMEAYQESAELNKKASFWTAWAVVFATISSIVGAIAS